MSSVYFGLPTSSNRCFSCKQRAGCMREWASFVVNWESTQRGRILHTGNFVWSLMWPAPPLCLALLYHHTQQNMCVMAVLFRTYISRRLVFADSVYLSNTRREGIWTSFLREISVLLMLMQLAHTACSYLSLRAVGVPFNDSTHQGGNLSNGFFPTFFRSLTLPHFFSVGMRDIGDFITMRKF